MLVYIATGLFGLLQNHFQHGNHQDCFTSVIKINHVNLFDNDCDFVIASSLQKVIRYSEFIRRSTALFKGNIPEITFRNSLSSLI